MTESAIAISTLESSVAAGRSLGSEIFEKLGSRSPDALIVFSSARHNHAQLLESLQEACKPKLMVGCTSAGEFSACDVKEGAVCVIGIVSNRLKFAAGVGRGLRADRGQVAKEIVSGFHGVKSNEWRYHTAVVLTDALAGYTDDFIDELTLVSGGKYQFVGGGAGDDAHFSETLVFYGTDVVRDGVVALEILSDEPVGIGVKHGWETASERMRVTEADGSRVISINATPALEALQEFAEVTGQNFDPKAPLPFFLHNIFGIETSTGHKLRVPLAIHDDGSISCASNVPVGSTVCIMRSTNHSAAEAASSAAQVAMTQLRGNTPKVAIFFDCVATRLRMGKDFGLELEALSKALDGIPFAGCNTYGQIARAEGQFSGFHNCTAVTCLLP